MDRPSIPFGTSHDTYRWFREAVQKHLGRAPEAIRGLPGGTGAPPVFVEISPVCGAVALSDMAAIHAAGLGDAEIVETIARDRRASAAIPVSGRCGA
jgi:hypothetical protein